MVEYQWLTNVLAAVGRSRSGESRACALMGRPTCASRGTDPERYPQSGVWTRLDAVVCAGRSLVNMHLIVADGRVAFAPVARWRTRHDERIMLAGAARMRVARLRARCDGQCASAGRERSAVALARVRARRSREEEERRCR